MGVSPSTFQALMEHAGAPCETYPVFENWNDFRCYFHLKHARFHLDAWQLDAAYEELREVEKTNWNQNKLYYQEYLFLHGMLQFRSGNANHQELYQLFLDALQLSRPELQLDNFKNLLLSIVEIELLIYLARTVLYISRTDMCLHICTQLQEYLENSHITFLEKNKLLAEFSVVYTQYLIDTKDYSRAFTVADANRHQMVVERSNPSLLELSFLTGICQWFLGRREEAQKMFKSVFYSAHAIQSSYTVAVRKIVERIMGSTLPENFFVLPDIPCKAYPPAKVISADTLSEGTFNIYSPEVVTIGKLIRALRLEQGVSLKVLSQGLCSISKLSKIENETLQPEVILAEALLQRLGFSEREFTFWANTRDAKFYELKFQLMRSRYLPDVDSRKTLEKLKDFLTKQDKLYEQFYWYMVGQHTADKDQKRAYFKQALDITLPDFDFKNILSYRLSWMELTILNNIAYSYVNTDEVYIGLELFKKILEYFQTIDLDTILQAHTYPATIHFYIRALDCQHYFKEIIDETKHLKYYFLYYAFGAGGLYNFFSAKLWVSVKCMSER